VRLRDRLRRWWSPAQWADDHPHDASARVGKPTKTLNVYEEAQKATLGPVDVERDFRKR
jgi:hypothetical protein